jgi:hypothetical protein
MNCAHACSRAHSLNNSDLIRYIIIIIVLPTMIAIIAKGKIIYKWLDINSIYIFTYSGNKLIDIIDELISDNIKISLNNYVGDDVNIDIKKSSLKELILYMFILIIQSLILYVIINIIIFLSLIIFPNSIINMWLTDSDILNIKIKESLVIGGLAYTSLIISPLFSTRNNLFKLYDEIILRRYNEDASLIILNKIIETKIKK